MWLVSLIDQQKDGRHISLKYLDPVMSFGGGAHAVLSTAQTKRVQTTKTIFSTISLYLTCLQMGLHTFSFSSSHVYLQSIEGAVCLHGVEVTCQCLAC